MTNKQLKAFIIAVLGLAGVVSITLYTGSINVTTNAIDPITIGGQNITFDCTDAIDGENLVIAIDKCEYKDGLSHAVVYVAVANRSGIAQDVELMAFFRGSGKRIRGISVLTNVTREVYEPVYTETCQQAKATSTKAVPKQVCTSTKTGTTTKQITEPTWAPLPTTKRDVVEVAKEAGYLEGKTRAQLTGFATEDKSIAFPIKKGEVLYYKVHIEFPPQQRDEFYFEAVGSAGGYGFMK